MPGDETESKLLGDYLSNRCDTTRNALFEHHWPRIRNAVVRFRKGRHRGRKAIPLDDILSLVVERILGKTIPEYDPALTEFRTHLFCHVFYAFLDALVILDRLTERVRARVHLVQCGIDTLSQTLGHLPTDAEVAEYLGITESEVIAIEPAIEVSGSCVDDYSCKRPTDAQKAAAFEGLIESSDRYHKRILELYYSGGYAGREIERLLGIPRHTIGRDLGIARESLRNLPPGDKTSENNK